MKRFHHGLGGALLAAAIFQIGCSQLPPASTALDEATGENLEVSRLRPQPGVGNPRSGMGGPVGLGGTVAMGEMGTPVPGLTQPQLAAYNNGKEVFHRVFQLKEGRVANDLSCVACHGGGGAGGASDKFAQNFVSISDPFSEAAMATGASLGNLGFAGHILGHNVIQPIPLPLTGQKVLYSPRLSTMTAGSGYMAAVPKSQILAREAAQATHMGISGRVILAAGAPGQPADQIGRFGWKNRTPSISGFNAGAHVNELGITSPAFPAVVDPLFIDFNGLPPGLPGGLTFLPPGSPTDISLKEKEELDVFTSLSLPPAPKYFDRAGYGAFKKAGCIECHWDGYTTTNNVNDLVPELQPYYRLLGGGKKVPMYSDLLVHNMGGGKAEPALDQLGRNALKGMGPADGVAEGDTKGDEYRTSPLWGLRFKTKFMHDGSAGTIDEAIRKHYYVSPSGNPAYNSEANEVVNNYLGKNIGKRGNLSPWERVALTKFLRGL